MLKHVKSAPRKQTVWKSSHHCVHLQTAGCLEFIDITEAILERVRQSGVRHGLVNVQTKHTTTALLVNEHEPLLLEDIKKILERLAPQDLAYLHNDFRIRTANLAPDEKENGHSHCKALLLRTSETLNLADGALQLGRWQRIFFIELDSARKRTVSIMILGQ
jgi:secondary thiamine-phosphate synthase enzyme